MHAPGLWGIVVIAVVIVLLFGRGKISGLMGELGSGITSFRRGLQDDRSAPAQQGEADAPVTSEPPSP